MTDTQPSGRDLCRDALAAYKTRTWAIPTTKTPPKKKPRRVLRGSGRDPIALGDLLGKLSEEQAWETGVKGGSLTDQWAELCPELVGKVHPAHFDAATGRLDLRPASPAYAAHLRMLGAQLVTRLQAKGVPVKSIRPLRPGPIPQPTAPGAADRLEEQASEPGPVRTREAASAGYRATLAAHQQHAVTDHGDPQMLAAVAAAAARPPLLREPEPADVTELGATRKVEAADTHARALAEARKQKAGRTPDLPTAFQRTA